MPDGQKMKELRYAVSTASLHHGEVDHSRDVAWDNVLQVLDELSQQYVALDRRIAELEGRSE